MRRRCKHIVPDRMMEACRLVNRYFFCYSFRFARSIDTDRSGQVDRGRSIEPPKRTARPGWLGRAAPRASTIDAKWPLGGLRRSQNRSRMAVRRVLGHPEALNELPGMIQSVPDAPWDRPGASQEHPESPPKRPGRKKETLLRCPAASGSAQRQ